MRICPMCASVQSEAGLATCQFCDYEEKPIEALSKQEIEALMAPYDYEWIEDGARIRAVKSLRLRGAVSLPHFVTEIAAGAFAGCKFLTRIDLPKGLRSIGGGAFAGCRDLFDVFIPENVQHIGRGAFADCNDLCVLCAAAPLPPCGWDREWLSGCSARVEWSSTDGA